MQEREKPTLYVALFVAFIDFMGVGLTYPLFSSMLFECSDCLVPASTSHEVRGMLLGLLLALVPLMQFFMAPIWGALSDNRGRKFPLQISIGVNLLGYLISVSGVLLNSIILLLASRAVIGISAGNMAIVQATVADLSTTKDKTKNFGLYSMALGVGFTLGPFIGGEFSAWHYTVPFIFAAILSGINLLVAIFFFRETHYQSIDRQLSWAMSFAQIKKAFHFKEFRVVLFASFLHYFAWAFFFQFVPIYLISRYQFTPLELGSFYGVSGGVYALSTGLLIRPFVKRIKPENLFFLGNVLTGLSIAGLLLLPSAAWMWPMLVALSFFVAFVTPSSTTLVSNYAAESIQGEALGILSSVNAAALVISPMISGIFVGIEPHLPLWVGSAVMVLAGLSVFIVSGSRWQS